MSEEIRRLIETWRAERRTVDTEWVSGYIKGRRKSADELEAALAPLSGPVDGETFVAEARAIVEKYAPGELGLLNHLVRRFREIAAGPVDASGEPTIDLERIKADWTHGYIDWQSDIEAFRAATRDVRRLVDEVERLRAAAVQASPAEEPR